MLGVSPSVPQTNGDVSVSENSVAANLELAKAADQHYLVQRWSDGTLCDKTGRGREIEIQVSRLLLSRLPRGFGL